MTDAQDDPRRDRKPRRAANLARETGQSFQDLIDQAIADLLKKHKRPVTLKDMLRESLATGGKAVTPPKRRRPA